MVSHISIYFVMLPIAALRLDIRNMLKSTPLRGLNWAYAPVKLSYTRGDEQWSVTAQASGREITGWDNHSGALYI